jgi:uncharacterized protein (TIGR03067 family)
MSTSTCPSRETLFQYSVGILSGKERDTLEDHLESCPACQATIVTLDESADTVVGRLRMSQGNDSVLAEPQLQGVLAIAMAMPAPSDNIKGDSEAAPASDMPTTLGEYRVLEELGRGGMGRVYKALHTKLDRVVAVKVLPRGRVGDRQAITRFEREMKAVGRLSHPNIVQAHDAREIGDTPVLIMEFVDGLDLAQVVRSVGPVPAADACELVRQTALALQCAHEHGLVHRDIKPSNIMLARSGEVKLLDLGLSRLYAGGDSSPGADRQSPAHGAASGGEEMTGAGQAMGTADYMAPEQASDSRTVDIRADLYSLGCTLYKLLSGRAPFSGPEFRTTFDKLHAHIHEPPTPIRRSVPDLPDALAAILDRLLAKDPDGRFATPAEVAEVLAPWCAGTDLPLLLRRALDARSLTRAANLRAESAVVQGEGGAADRLPATKAPWLLTSWGWKWLAGQLVLLMLAFGLGIASGIMIRIHKDGRETVVDVPEGSRARVTADGQVDLTLPGRSQTAELATPDEEAIQGTWEVLGSTFSLVRKLPFDRQTSPTQVLKTTKVVITNDTLKIVGPDVTIFAFQYQLNPAAAPKKIDLQTPGATFGLISFGIYELEGNRLKICTSGPRCLGDGRHPPDVQALRPSEFWAGLGAERELLVLRRVGGATLAAATEDEKAIQGTWRVEDGPKRFLEGLNRDVQIEFSRHGITPSRPNGTRESSDWIQYGYALDPTATPKRIDLGNVTEPALNSVHGVYELAGNRLTIRWVSPDADRPPSKLAPTPDSTVFVLKRITAASEKTPRREIVPQNPANSSRTPEIKQGPGKSSAPGMGMY